MSQRESMGAGSDGACLFPGKGRPARKPTRIGIASPVPESLDPAAAPVASLPPLAAALPGLTLCVQRLSGKRVQPFKETSSFAIARLVRDEVIE